MKIGLLLACIAVIGAFVGAEVSSWRAGDLVPETNAITKECAAIDTGQHKIVGYWMMTPRGCHLRDWRFPWHPF